MGWLKEAAKSASNATGGLGGGIPNVAGGENPLSDLSMDSFTGAKSKRHKGQTAEREKEELKANLADGEITQEQFDARKVAGTDPAKAAQLTAMATNAEEQAANAQSMSPVEFAQYIRQSAVGLGASPEISLDEILMADPENFVQIGADPAQAEGFRELFKANSATLMPTIVQYEQEATQARDMARDVGSQTLQDLSGRTDLSDQEKNFLVEQSTQRAEQAISSQAASMKGRFDPATGREIIRQTGEAQQAAQGQARGIAISEEQRRRESLAGIAGSEQGLNFGEAQQRGQFEASLGQQGNIAQAGMNQQANMQSSGQLSQALMAQAQMQAQQQQAAGQMQFGQQQYNADQAAQYGLTAAQMGQSNNQLNAQLQQQTNMTQFGADQQTALQNAAMQQQAALQNAAAQNLVASQNAQMTQAANAQGAQAQMAGDMTNIGIAQQSNLAGQAQLAGLLNQQQNQNLGTGQIEAGITAQQQQAASAQAGADQNLQGAGIGAAGAIGAAAIMASDATVKKDIENTSDEELSEFFSAVTPTNWNYKDPDKHGKGRYTGMILQDVENTKLGADMITEVNGVKMFDKDKLLGILLAQAANQNKGDK